LASTTGASAANLVMRCAPPRCETENDLRLDHCKKRAILTGRNGRCTRRQSAQTSSGNPERAQRRPTDRRGAARRKAIGRRRAASPIPRQAWEVRLDPDRGLTQEHSDIGPRAGASRLECGVHGPCHDQAPQVPGCHIQGVNRPSPWPGQEQRTPASVARAPWERIDSYVQHDDLAGAPNPATAETTGHVAPVGTVAISTELALPGRSSRRRRR